MTLYPARFRDVVCVCGHFGGYHAIGEPHRCLHGRIRPGENGTCNCTVFRIFEANNLLKELLDK